MVGFQTPLRGEGGEGELVLGWLGPKGKEAAAI